MDACSGMGQGRRLHGPRLPTRRMIYIHKLPRLPLNRLRISGGGGEVDLGPPSLARYGKLDQILLHTFADCSGIEPLLHRRIMVL